MPEVPNLAQNAARMREQMKDEQEAPKVIEAVTAFTVYITKEGMVGSVSDLDQPITKQRDPAMEEISYACLRIHDELTLQRSAAMTAIETINRSMSVQQQMRAQQEQEAVKQRMEREANGVPPAFQHG